MALTKVSRGLLSTGIVDNSNATAITLNADESATFAGNVGIGVVPSADSYFKSLEIGTIGSGITGRGAADTHLMSGLIWDGASTQEYTVSSVAVGKYQITNGIHYWSTAPAGTAGNAATPQTNMTLDASGNLLVGRTSVGTSGAGHSIRGDSSAIFSRTSGEAISANSDADGAVIKIRKSGTSVGGLFSYAGTRLGIGSNGVAGILFATNEILPATSGNTLADNTYDVGGASYRWDDIYATNGTIQTSDRNEKQDIAELSDAEQRVAVACKGLLRKFRWKDSVAEKGDEARIHFGIIAQDLQDEFAAEGLDAGDYAMFISTTWTDEETNEEKTRMGVRYSELLAFIISAI